VNIDYDWIKKAIETVKSGLTNRVDSPDKSVAVYMCCTVIRVDIKRY